MVGWRRVAPSRRLGMLGGTIAIACIACSPAASRSGVVYELASVGGEPLPAAVVSAQTTSGRTYTVEAVGGQLTLFSDGTFERVRKLRNVWDGVADDTLNDGGFFVGKFDRDDIQVMLHFTDERGGPASATYSILDSGTALRGIETLAGHFATTYEYRIP